MQNTSGSEPCAGCQAGFRAGCMRSERHSAILLILFFLIGALILGIFISERMAEMGLWCLPALCHLYPFITLFFVGIYSVITSRKIYWFQLTVLLALGLVLECAMFLLNKFFVFASPRLMAFFVFFQIIMIYGATWVLYFSLTSKDQRWRRMH